MPESILHLYNEAGLIYNKSPRAACALLRLAIDRLCNELGETDRDINKNEWFTYSDNSIDGQSKKYEKNIVAGIQAVVRTSRQPW